MPSRFESVEKKRARMTERGWEREWDWLISEGRERLSKTNSANICDTWQLIHVDRLFLFVFRSFFFLSVCFIILFCGGFFFSFFFSLFLLGHSSLSCLSPAFLSFFRLISSFVTFFFRLSNWIMAEEIFELNNLPHSNSLVSINSPLTSPKPALPSPTRHLPSPSPSNTPLFSFLPLFHFLFLCSSSFFSDICSFFSLMNSSWCSRHSRFTCWFWTTKKRGVQSLLAIFFRHSFSLFDLFICMFEGIGYSSHPPAEHVCILHCRSRQSCVSSCGCWRHQRCWIDLCTSQSPGLFLVGFWSCVQVVDVIVHRSLLKILCVRVLNVTLLTFDEVCDLIPFVFFFCVRMLKFWRTDWLRSSLELAGQRFSVVVCAYSVESS